MKILAKTPATAVARKTAKSRIRMFHSLKQIAFWLIIGIFVLAAIGAAYQAIAT